MMVSLKGQITAEFLIVIIALLFILGFALSVYSSNLKLFSGFKQVSEMKVMASRVGIALDSVLFAGDGASAEFFFERKSDFNASLSGNVLTMRASNALVDYPLATSEINFSKFEFNKKLKILNNAGKLEVELVEQ